MCIKTVTCAILINSFDITDINECQFNNGQCGHHCTNTDGSYYCTCNAGYRLTTNKHSCVGMYVLLFICNCVMFLFFITIPLGTI